MHTYHVTPLLEGYEKTKQMVYFKPFGDGSIQNKPYGITVVNAFVFSYKGTSCKFCFSMIRA